MRRHLPGLALILLAACSSSAATPNPPHTEPAPQSPEAAPQAPASAASSPQSCDQRVDALEAWLASAEWDPPSIVSKDALPKLPRELFVWSKRQDPAPMIMVHAGSIRLDGSTVETDGQPLAQVARDLGAELLARRKAGGREGPDSVTLIASPGARWEHVVAAMEGAARAGLAVDIAFEAPRRLPREPEPSPLGDRLAVTFGDATAYARVSEELFGACTPAISVFGDVATAGDRKHEVLVQGIPRALRECSCRPSPDDARTWFWHVVFSGHEPGLRVVRVQVTGRGDFKGVGVRAAAGETWQQVLPKVIDAARPGTENRLVRVEVQSGGTGNQAAPSESPPAQAESSAPGGTGTPLTDDVAIAFATELHILRKGSLHDAAPVVVALPKRLVRPPLWGNDGRLYVALDGGDVAVVDGGVLRVIEIPTALRKMKRPQRGFRARRGWSWTDSDSLVAATDGSVWMLRCQWAERKGSCGATAHFRLDTPEVTRTEAYPSARTGTPWPALSEPYGYLASFIDGRSLVSCQGPAGLRRLPLPGPLSSGRDTIWVTRDPARLLVRFHLLERVMESRPSRVGGVGDGGELHVIGEGAAISTECGSLARAAAVAGAGGLYAYGLGGTWTLGHGGKALRELPGALTVALGGASGWATADMMK